MMGYYQYGIVGWLGMILFWGALIWLIVWLVDRSRTVVPQEGKDAMHILKERYAKGELSHEEFMKMKRVLSS